MFCKDCGAQLGSNSHFCPNCGSAQAVTPPAQPVTPPAQPANFADKVRATAKKVGSSPLFLIATICFTLVQLLGLLTLMPTGNTFETYSDIFAEFGFVGLELLAALDDLSLVTDTISMIPGILIAIGLWITYGTCVSRKTTVNTAGLTMIFVVNLVELAISCLALLAAAIPLAALLVGADQLFDAGEDFVEMIVLTFGLIFLVVFAFVLVYYIKVCTTVSNGRNTLKTGVPNKRASRFVGVMCYISGALLFLSGIGSLFSTGIMSLDSFYDDSLSYVLPSTLFLSGISTLLTAATQILFGVLIFSYRSKMAVLETEERMNTFKTLSYAEPYTAPVYIPPQPAAEPEVVAEPKVIEEPATEEETE